MPFTANVGETVVDLNTGAKFRVADAPMDLDETKYGRVQGGVGAIPPEARNAAKMMPPADSQQKFMDNANAMSDKMQQDVRQAAATGQSLLQASQANAAPAPMAPMSPEVRAAGQKSATSEPAFQGLAKSTIPAAAMAAGLIPGMQGPVAGALLGGGSTALNQAAGFEPFNLWEIAKSAAIAPLMQGAVGAAKSVFRQGGAAVAPHAVRESGVEAANQMMGNEAKSIERVGAPTASGALYRQAEQVGDVPLTGINRTINSTWDRLTNMSNAPTRATKYLENLSNKYAGKATTTYDDLKDELQLLKSNADKAIQQKDPVTGRELYKARAALLNEADQVSPALKQANAAYRREQATQEVTNALRKANPNNKIREVFETDPLIAGAFDKRATQDIYDIADKLASIGVQGSPYSGVTAKIFNAVAAPVASLMTTNTGRAMLRQTFKNGVTPQSLSIAAQFGRAYRAQEGD